MSNPSKGGTKPQGAKPAAETKPATTATAPAGGGAENPAGGAPAAEAKTEIKTGAKAAKVPGIRVVSRIDGFRRAGRGWPAVPTTVAVDQFSEDELKLIREEPNLIVVDVADISAGQE